jgi:putative membrane protein
MPIETNNNIMKTGKIMMMMLLGSLLSFQACKDDDDSELKMDNSTFVTQAASGNMLEIKAGAMAVQKGNNNEVKEYGQHMVTDHTKASAELMLMANSKEMDVPESLTEKHQQMLNTLTPLSGTAFDKQFMKLMVQSHQEQVDLFQRASTDVKDKDFRTLASKKLPVLKEHLEEAIELNATINK